MDKKQKKILKVMNISELDQNVVSSVLKEMGRINQLNIHGLMKYKLIETDGKYIYRISGGYKVHLDEINPLEVFEENGPFDVLYGILIILKNLDENKAFHSDLKPSNIFLSGKNEVILNDYSNSLLYKGRENMRVMKLIDLCFVSIDELLGLELDIYSDIWNFGLIFYYVISGKYPFVGSNLSATMLNILNVKYIPLEGDYSDDFNLLVSKLLQKEKKNRMKLNSIMKELESMNYIYNIEIVMKYE